MIKEDQDDNIHDNYDDSNDQHDNYYNINDILTTHYLSCIHPDFMGGKWSEGLIAIARVSLHNFMWCICICVFVFMQTDYLHAAHTAAG